MPKKSAQEPKNNKAQLPKEAGLRRRKSAGDTLIYTDTPGRLGMFVRGVRSEIIFPLVEGDEEFWMKYKGLILFHVAVNVYDLENTAPEDIQILEGMSLNPEDFIAGDIVAAGQVKRVVKYDPVSFQARCKLHGIYQTLEAYCEEQELIPDMVCRMEVEQVGLFKEPVLDVGAEVPDVLWVPRDEGHLAAVKLANERLENLVFSSLDDAKQCQDLVWSYESSELGQA